MERLISSGDRDTGIATSSKPVVGQIIEAAQSPGAGWLPCDGKSYIRETYPELSAKFSEAGIQQLTIPFDPNINFFGDNLFFIATPIQNGFITFNHQSSETPGVKKALRFTIAGTTTSYDEVILFPQSLRESGTAVAVFNPTTSEIVVFYQSATINVNDVHVTVSNDNGVTWTEKASISNFGILGMFTTVWDGINYRIFDSVTVGKLTQSTDLTNWTTYNLPAKYTSVENPYILAVTPDAYYPGWINIFMGGQYIIALGNPAANDHYQSGEIVPFTEFLFPTYMYNGHNKVILRDMMRNIYFINDPLFNFPVLQKAPNDYQPSYSFNVGEIGTEGDLILPVSFMFSADAFVYYKKVIGYTEIITFDTPFRFFTFVNMLDHSVLGICGDIDENMYIMILKKSESYFRVPGFLPSSAGLQKYIYAGNIVVPAEPEGPGAPT